MKQNNRVKWIVAGVVLTGLGVAAGARAADSFQDWLSKDREERARFATGGAEAAPTAPGSDKTNTAATAGARPRARTCRRARTRRPPTATGW